MIKHKHSISRRTVIVPWQKTGIEDNIDPYENKVVLFVTNRYGLTVRQVLEQDRRPDIVFARHLIVYLLYLGGDGPVKIGKIVHRHRTIVNHVLTVMLDYMDTGHARADEIRSAAADFEGE